MEEGEEHRAWLKEHLLAPEQVKYYIDDVAKVIPGGSTAIHSWNEIRMHVKATEAELAKRSEEIGEFHRRLDLSSRTARGFMSERDQARAELAEAHRRALVDDSQVNGARELALQMAKERDALAAKHALEAGLWDEQHQQQHRVNTQLAAKVSRYEALLRLHVNVPPHGEAIRKAISEGEGHEPN